MASPSFFRTPYARTVFGFVRWGFAATGLLFLVLATMGFSDAILGTGFGYKLSDGLLGLLATALCACGWALVGAIYSKLMTTGSSWSEGR